MTDTSGTSTSLSGECAKSLTQAPAFELTKREAVTVDGVHYFACPHCGVAISVEVVACGIFRCGVLKNGQPVPPHADRATCERLVKQGKVWGCAKPFKFDGRVVVECDYV
jgi:hypothetical protein